VSSSSADAARAPSSGPLAGAPVAADPAPVEREIARLASGLVTRIFAHYQARAAELSLSMPEAKALGALEVDQPLSMRELASRVHASPSNLTVTVDRLEARGLIVRRGGSDRRVKGVLLTEAGLALKQRLDERLLTDHPASRGLDAAQRAALVDLLRTLVQSGE